MASNDVTPDAYRDAVRLCPNCFNSPENCECDPPFVAGTTQTLRSSERKTPSTPESASIETVLDDVDPRRRAYLGRFLRELVALGCWIERPAAVRQNYVNVQPPRSFGVGRVCSVNRSTGRIEFQTDTYSIAESLGAAELFTFLAAGAKAALTPTDDRDVDAALSVARAVLGARRGRS